MVTKRIRSEYMKKFKDPKWETYSRCYEEMLKYRLTRRLLEHTHNPWFWSGSESDSDSGGRSPRSPPNKNQVQAEASGNRAEVEECERVRTEELLAKTVEPVPRIPIQDGEEENILAVERPKETQVLQEEREEQRASSRGSKKLTALQKEAAKEPGGPQSQLSKPSKSSKQIWRAQRVRPVPPRQPWDESRDGRHPFALYGSGEKDADMAARKTHNVGPAASTKEIHEAALRAKTRREVERQIQTQRTERRRAKSADTDKSKKVVQPKFNPWLTEYMRCFSARSR